MHIEYDIFGTFADSGPIWIESVKDLEVAKERVARLMHNQPGEYRIYDLSRGQIVFSRRAAAKN